MDSVKAALGISGFKFKSQRLADHAMPRILSVVFENKPDSFNNSQYAYLKAGKILVS